ncbi:MAG: DUF4825 domain-containing protein [Clostridia bacterium]
MDQMKIGKFIAYLRKEKKMTQQELADKLGISFKTISKWETGRGMPDLSLFKPLCEELDITINELLSGEKIIKEEYQEKLEENIFNTINYSNKKINNKNNSMATIILVFGFLITLTATSIFPSESSWSSIYSVIGIIVALIGFSRFTKKIEYSKRVVLNFGFFIICIAILFILDFANVLNNNLPPKFSLKTQTMDKAIIYNTPFYNVFRININTPNEYYIIDTKKEYNINTIPLTPFNRDKSGIDNIIKYRNKYVGNNSNDGALINNLPLSEYGYAFKIDSEKMGLSIDYHTSDWYINENLYLQKSLIYNSVSIFSLIDNVEYITYNFSGKSYKVERNVVENNYPNFLKIKNNNIIDKAKFNEYVENKMNDNEFSNNIFNKLF